MTSESDLIFDVREVSYAYNQVDALDRVSLQIRKGERVALLGANGSGKSTLLRLLAALSFPNYGTISFLGEDLSASQLKDDGWFFPFRRRVGFLFQNPDVQLFNVSVFDELAFGPLQLGWSTQEIRERVLSTLAAMDIIRLKDRPPHRLSGGEKKRVALASVLVLDPDVLLLDEPAAGLDPASAAQMVDLLSSWKDGSKTVIIATHDLDVLEEIADRCYILESGRVVAEGAPLTVLHDVSLLERTSLLRPHAHLHEKQSPHPHPHVHRQESY